MFPDNKTIKIFSICDDFSKGFDKTLEQNAVESNSKCKVSKSDKVGKIGTAVCGTAFTVV